ncbi:hypothetical protein HDV05_003462 [Chytridiales sp. JEL 0842]|nr:hypothetical protein HDV05_003462 [Chytridiales sp. JEL 0842]
MIASTSTTAAAALFALLHSSVSLVAAQATPPRPDSQGTVYAARCPVELQDNFNTCVGNTLTDPAGALQVTVEAFCAPSSTTPPVYQDCLCNKFSAVGQCYTNALCTGDNSYASLVTARDAACRNAIQLNPSRTSSAVGPTAAVTTVNNNPGGAQPTLPPVGGDAATPTGTTTGTGKSGAVATTVATAGFNWLMAGVVGAIGLFAF